MIWNKKNRTYILAKVQVIIPALGFCQDPIDRDIVHVATTDCNTNKN